MDSVFSGKFYYHISDMNSPHSRRVLGLALLEVDDHRMYALHSRLGLTARFYRFRCTGLKYVVLGSNGVFVVLSQDRASV